MEYEAPVTSGRVRPAECPIRQASWVRVGKSVGIAHELFTTGDNGLRPLMHPEETVTHIEFHVVDGAGNTVSVELEDIKRVTQAALLDIPLPRRPSSEVGARLGYR